MRFWFKSVGAYVLLVSAGTVAFLLAFSAVGYLGYSDRPGPGWGNVPAHWPNWEEIRYFSGWAALLLPMCYFYGHPLFMFMALIRWLGAPGWMARALGALFSAGFTVLIVSVAGWYIALSAAVVHGIGICALLFGAWILPGVAPVRDKQLSLATRGVGIALASVAVGVLLVLPFLG